MTRHYRVLLWVFVGIGVLLTPSLLFYLVQDAGSPRYAALAGYSFGLSMASYAGLRMYLAQRRLVLDLLADVKEMRGH